MKVAVVGSRGLHVEDLGRYLPADTTEIVSGGAVGVDTSAREYALAHGLLLTEFRPDYSRYGRSAPLRRNRQIVDYADLVLLFWDGSSHGTRHVLNLCRSLFEAAYLHRKSGGMKPQLFAFYQNPSAGTGLRHFHNPCARSASRLSLVRPCRLRRPS